jgi:hypothetical protein
MSRTLDNTLGAMVPLGAAAAATSDHQHRLDSTGMVRRDLVAIARGWVAKDGQCAV